MRAAFRTSIWDRSIADVARDMLKVGMAVEKQRELGTFDLR
jgi:hypothetical protein